MAVFQHNLLKIPKTIADTTRNTTTEAFKNCGLDKFKTL